MAPGSTESSDGIAIEVRTTLDGGKPARIGPVDPARRQIFGALDVVNVPQDNEVVLASLAGQLSFSDGTVLQFANRSHYVYGGALAGIGGEYQGMPAPHGTTCVDLLEVSDAEYRKWSTHPGTYSGTAQFQRYRLVRRGELRLDVGARLAVGSTLTVISEVLPASGRFLAEVSGRCIDLNTLSIFVLNRKLQQVLGAESGSSAQRQLILPGSYVFYWTKNFGPDLKRQRVWDAAWIADAIVLVIERVEAGRFSRTFRVDNFRMSENTYDQWRQRSGR
jgi:hypothetical protein